MAELSADALYLGASMFSMMKPGEGRLTFQMRESKPSPRTQAALDELVAAGKIRVEPFNEHGGVVYTPLVVFKRRTGTPHGDWPITVPIDAGRAALRSPAGGQFGIEPGFVVFSLERKP